MTELGQHANDIDDINDRLFAEYHRSDAVASYDTVANLEYSTGHFYQDVPSTDTVTLTLQNPVDSGEYLFVNGLVRAEGKVYFQKMLNVSITSAGPSAVIESRRSDIDNGNVSDAYYNSTVDTTNANKFNKKVLGGAGRGRLQNPGVGGGPSTIVAPGDSVHYQVENQSGNTIDLSIDVDFTEIPAELVASMTP